MFQEEVENLVKSYISNNLSKEEFFKKLYEIKEKVKIEESEENLIIELELNKSIGENAEKYYKKAKKISNLIKSEEHKLKLLLDKLNKLKKGVLEEKRRKEEIKKLEELFKKGKWYEKYRYFISSEGELVICGKDATSNEVLIKKHSKDFKWVLHTEMPGSPFCLTNGGEKTLQEAADFLIIFSKAWKNGLSSGDVFYVKPEQLSKKTESGEYIKKGSFIIRGKKFFLKGVAKYSIGIKINKEKNKIEEIIFGPYSSIKERADYWITLVPGKKKSKEIAKLIAQKFKIKQWQIFLDLIPPGGSEISKSESRIF